MCVCWGHQSPKVITAMCVMEGCLCFSVSVKQTEGKTEKKTVQLPITTLATYWKKEEIQVNTWQNINTDPEYAASINAGQVGNEEGWMDTWMDGSPVFWLYLQSLGPGSNMTWRRLPGVKGTHSQPKVFNQRSCAFVWVVDGKASKSRITPGPHGVNRSNHHPSHLFFFPVITSLKQSFGVPLFDWNVNGQIAHLLLLIWI